MHVIRESGLTQKDAAERAGVTPQELSDITHGRRPVSSALAERVSRAFGVSPGWLLFGEDPTASVAEGEAVYARGVRLHGINGEGADLPPGTAVYTVEGNELGPAWRAGERLLVVRAAKRAAGPGVVRHRRAAWRILGKLY